MGKIEIVLPYTKETPGTVVYGIKNVVSVPVGQIYIRKKYLDQKEDGSWPASVTVTVEVPES